MISILLYLIEVILIAYFGLNSLYLLFYAVSAHFYKLKLSTKDKQNIKCAIVYCAYKESNVILETAISAQKYIEPNDVLLVIADQINSTTIQSLREAQIEVLEVQFEQSTKVKSLKSACSYLKSKHIDLILIMDIDNELSHNSIYDIKNAFANGYKAIQCHRTAKNNETSVAILDGISEEINNHIFRKGHAAIGLSSALIGSGMAFDFHLFNSLIEQNKAIGGFDKELEIQLVLNKVNVAYLHKTLIFDEKVSDLNNLKNQRRRWLSAQFIYLKHFLVSTPLKDYFNIHILNKLIQYTILPRVLLLGMVMFLLALHLIGWNYFTLYWIVIALLLCISLFISVPKTLFTFQTFKAVLQLPNTFFVIFLNVFKLKHANKSFIHTQHKSKSNS